MSWVRQSDDGVVINVRVVPRASINELSGLIGDELKVRLQSPPVDGKANKALVKFFARELGVSSKDIAIVAGGKSRNKRVLIGGVDASRVRETLTGRGGSGSQAKE